MRMRPLGKTGIEVSEIGLGGLFTSCLGPGFEESERAVHRALDLGVNYIDTAPAYADSEETLGRILRNVKVSIVLSTKLGGRPQPFQPKHKEHLRFSVRESLKLLGRDVIDILFVHEPDRPMQYDWWTDWEAVYGPVIDVLDQLKKAGDIRFTGLGGTTVAELAHCIRSDRFDVVLTAFNYSALFREAEWEVLPAAKERNMGVVLGSVLQQGALGRRYDEVVRRKPPWLSEPRRQQLLAFYQLLDELAMPIVELCIRFAITNPEISSALIGPKTVRHVEEAVRYAQKGPLPNDVLLRLREIADMVPFRPFEEPMVLPLNRPDSYRGPGRANTGSGAPVGRTGC
ncbi:MAG: dTDP-4-keto-L-6-deoxy-hexose 2,3-reductase [Gemmatales bacterium]|nr:MAG: dTDP-4-keto-L-6-deoxy-hexose 2,3-reductase [Gemmatales bacterium]